jgi:hypothetical protein
MPRTRTMPVTDSAVIDPPAPAAPPAPPTPRAS